MLFEDEKKCFLYLLTSFICCSIIKLERHFRKSIQCNVKIISSSRLPVFLVQIFVVKGSVIYVETILILVKIFVTKTERFDAQIIFRCTQTSNMIVFCKRGNTLELYPCWRLSSVPPLALNLFLTREQLGI